MPASSPIRLILIDDSEDYLRTFTHVLEQFGKLTCIGMFRTIEEALAGWRSLVEEADVVLVDIEIEGGMSGIEGVRYLKEAMPDTPIVMLTSHETSALIFESLKAGAAGYIPKWIDFEDKVAMIRNAVEGALLMEPAVARKVLGFFRNQEPQNDYGLSDREYDVLHALCKGLAQKEIAERLFIAPSTVDNHLRSIYRKLHVNSGIQAVAKAFRERLIDPEE